MKGTKRITCLAASFFCLLLTVNIEADVVYDRSFYLTETVCYPQTPPGRSAFQKNIQPLQNKETPPGSIQISGKFTDKSGVGGCSSIGLTTGLRPSGLQTASHLHTLRIVVKYISAKGILLGTFTFNVHVNSDGTISKQKFPIAGFTIKAKEKLNISIIPVEGFLAPQNILTLTIKFPV